MGLFQNKKQQTPQQQAADEITHLFDDTFREELKERGRLYFERVINENAALFKQDLDATVAHINTELRQHVARQLDEQFAQINKVNNELREHIAGQFDEQFTQYSKTLKDAQSLALDAVTRSSQALEEQHKQLSTSLEKSVANQDAQIAGAVQENKAHIEQMQAVQVAAVQSLQNSAQALEEQHKQISVLLESGIANQQSIIIETFEKNMAQIIEHYLLGALGDQYDLKAQLPAIIKQMEENKQAIADDMKL